MDKLDEMKTRIEAVDHSSRTREISPGEVERMNGIDPFGTHSFLPPHNFNANISSGVMQRRRVDPGYFLRTEGTLYKKTRDGVLFGVEQWQARFFILVEQNGEWFLKYSVSEANRGKVKGSWSMTESMESEDGVSIKELNGTGKGKYGFVLTGLVGGGRSKLELSADSEDDRDAWMTTLNSLISQLRSSHAHVESGVSGNLVVHEKLLKCILGLLKKFDIEDVIPAPACRSDCILT